MNLQAAFDWYSQLAKSAGWRDYVWDRVREMAREFPETFGQLPTMLLQRHPRLSQYAMERPHETKANTYRLRLDRFHAPAVAHKRKERT